MNGFETPKKGYLAFYVVDKENGFKDRLPFKKELYEIETNPSDIPGIFKEAVSLLKKETPPPHNSDCEYGNWINKITKL